MWKEIYPGTEVFVDEYGYVCNATVIIPGVISETPAHPYRRNERYQGWDNCTGRYKWDYFRKLLREGKVRIL